MTDITMPQLGETVTEGTITRWAKQVGDQVAEDEILYEVSTDKVDSEVPSPTSGVLTEILVNEGDTVPVGTKLAVIGDGDGAAATAAKAEPEKEAEPEPKEEEAEAAAEPEPEPEPEPEEAPAPKEEPEPAKAKAPPKEEPAKPAPPDTPESDGLLLSPVVRKLVAEHGLDPSTIKGTGVGGRITRSDVLKVVEGGGGQAAEPAAKTEPEGALSAAKSTPAPLPAAKPGERDEVIPFSRIRKVTAEHMIKSKATSAHTLITVEVDYVGVERVRAARKDSFKAENGFSLTYLPFIARAVVDAIAEFPHVNSSVGDNELVVHRYIDLGVAVDLNFEGLLVPVIRDAETKRLAALAKEISDLAQKARNKRLSPDDLVGGTFTLTNAGPFGTFMTSPVINQPQTAILSTDGIRKRPVAIELPDGSDGIAVHPVGILALNFDHRAYDGAYAAAFMDRVRTILETRDWSAEV